MALEIDKVKYQSRLGLTSDELNQLLPTLEMIIETCIDDYLLGLEQEYESESSNLLSSIKSEASR